MGDYSDEVSNPGFDPDVSVKEDHPSPGSSDDSQVPELVSLQHRWHQATLFVPFAGISLLYYHFSIIPTREIESCDPDRHISVPGSHSAQNRFHRLPLLMMITTGSFFMMLFMPGGTGY